MFKTRYRVVRDAFCGYEAQVRRWWWPFWMQMGFTNTHSTLEQAQRYIELSKQPEVWRAE